MMARILIQVIKRILAVFGLGIYRIRSTVNQTQDHEIHPIYYNSKEGMNEFYANPNNLVVLDGPEQSAFYREVIAVLRTTGVDGNNLRIADIGCGTGHLLLHLRDSFDSSSLTGFDFSEEALRIARTVVPEAKLIRAEISELVSIENRFDIVCCTEVLEHVLFAELALRNILSIVGMRGIAIVTVPDGRIDTYGGHINFWSPESWRVFVERFGADFEIDTGSLEMGRTMFALFQRKTSMAIYEEKTVDTHDIARKLSTSD